MMKYINKIAVLLVFALAFVACDENENFEILPKQDSFEIVTPSSGTVMVLDDENLLNEALFLSWEDINGPEATTYTVEVAETGTDFASPIVLGTSAMKNFSMNVGDLNTFLLENLGFTAAEAASLDFRVSENSRFTPVIALVFTATEIEYTDIAIYGTFNDWDAMTAVPMNSKGFNQYELIIELGENDEFLFNTQKAGAEGDFGMDPANEGMVIKGGSNIAVGEANEYRIKLDLNTMTYSVQLAVYPNLYLVGDATAAGWSENNGNHPMFKDPDQGGLYHYVGYFNAGSVKLLEQIGSWQPQWGMGANEGELAGNPGTQSGDPGTISIPTDGYYTLTVDLANLTYSVEAYDASGATEYATIGVIGRATPTAWDSDTDMVQSTFNPHIWSLDLDLNQSDGGDCDCGFKFRANDLWDENWGGVQNPPTLHHGIAELNGKNIGVPETGNYTIYFNTLDFRYYYVLNEG